MASGRLESPPGARNSRGTGQAISVVPGQDYGDRTQQEQDQRQNPLAATAPPPQPVPLTDDQAQDVAAATPAYQGGDFMRPTDRPDEPITHGVPIGPGSNSLSLPQPANAQPTGQMTSLLQKLAANDTTGLLSRLLDSAQQYGI